jgi:hypothetical protein
MLNGYKTYVGLIIAAIPNVAHLFGYETLPGFSEQAAEVVDSFITVTGLVVALYGRLVAQVPGWFAPKK